MTAPTLTAEDWRRIVLERIDAGDGFAGVYATAEGQAARLSALLDSGVHVAPVDVVIAPGPRGELRYPSLTPDVPSAFWYERALHDLSGVVPDGHPRLDPLLLPRREDAAPRPGSGDQREPFERISTDPGPVDVTGRGLFVLPLGPVRSGVFESIEFLLETPGEDIPHLTIRPHFKHRGVARRFEGHDAADGVLIAERVEGIASVAHALAFSHAVEQHGAPVPRRAQLVRIVVAELERVANHLDVAMRMADAAGLAVAAARTGWHKEEVMRLQSALTGSRFGRSVVVPGGVSRDLRGDPVDVTVRTDILRRHVADDTARMMKTPSFLDRLRGTGVLSAARADELELTGPIGRASGRAVDARWTRPTDAYPHLPLGSGPAVATGGDVHARLAVRFQEIEASFRMVREALRQMPLSPPQLLAAATFPVERSTALGWAEAPQGETLYAITSEDGRIVRCFARSASLHNLPALHDAFNGDVFTDFPFIEASFGLGYAGAAM